MLKTGEAKFIETAFLKRAVFFFFVAGCVIFFCFSAYSQSSLEYAALLTKQAAGSVKKDKGNGPGVFQDGADAAAMAFKKVYSDSAAVVSRGGGMLDQVGKPSQQAESQGKENVSEPALGEKGEASEDEKSQDAELGAGDQTAEIHLKSGQVIKGSHFKQGDKSAEINCQGVVLTYFNDEIDKIVVFE